MTELDAMAAQFADAALPFSDPEGAAARATAEPMAMYAERAARCPVERIGDDFVVLLKMADILYVNKRRLLDPVFTAKRVAPLADSVRALADEMIDGFADDGEVRAYERWCEPLPSTIFLSILGLPVADLDDFLHFKSLTLGNEFATLPFDEAMARREEAVVWIHDYFNQLLDDRLGADDPGDDLLGWLLTTEVEGERLPREDLLDILGLLMIAGLAELTFVHHQNTVGALDRGQTMRDHNRRAAFHHAAKGIPDLKFSLCIHTRSRFVENQNLRIVRQRPSE